MLLCALRYTTEEQALQDDLGRRHEAHFSNGHHGGCVMDPANGRVIMSSRSLGNCIACHMTTDLIEFPFHGNVGPTLDGVADRWGEAELRGIVANAKLTFADSVMPSFYKTEGYIRPGDAYTGKAAPESGLSTLLTAQQVEDVVAYLMTLKES